MKVAIVILAVAIVGAFAQETTTKSGPPPFVCTSNAFVCKFKELGHHIKYHAIKLGSQLKKVGSSVLGAALEQGKNLLANGAQAVLGTVLEHLNKEGITGKREIAFFDKVKSHLANGIKFVKEFKEKIHDAYKKAVNKLTDVISKQGALASVEKDTDKKIDDVVAAYKKSGKHGFFGMAKAIAGKIRDIFGAGIKMLKEKFAAKKMDERAIFGFNSLSDAWNKAKEHLKNIAGSIASTFKPHIENLKSGISALASKAREHAGKLIDAAKGSFNDLKNKLSGHIDALKGHVGKLGTHAVNAVNALKEAVASIATQAVGNVSGTVKDIVKTGSDAAKVVGGHVAKAIKGATN